tara:strand:+ start:101 stop:526 length:426 start_codon:yes stop_codon:yes gene_type:complete
MSPYKNPEDKRAADLRYYYRNKERFAERNKQYHIETRAQRVANRNAHKQFLIDYLGGKCVSCGTTENLEFDHIDPNTKRYNVSKVIPDTSPETPLCQSVWEEVNKCQLLCKSCHRKKTYTLDHETIMEKKRETRAKNNEST